MAGIYIHIPFCRRKCHYCNFYSLASIKHRGEFLETLLKEIEIRGEYLQNENVNTIYLGGGTPSLLSKQEINQIITQIKNHFNVHDNVEITLEANPDDLKENKLLQIKDANVNRLSIGIQSFHNDDLKYLNRLHNAEDALNSIEKAKSAGFENISIDLIYGIPGLTIEKWGKNMDVFFNLQIPHLSAYALTVEEKTPLKHFIKQGKLQPPDENESISHFQILMEKIKENGFIHYEISNFAKEGFYSKHNSIYWVGGNYLGLGPSAHSYNGKSRQWNTSNIKKYIDKLSFDEKIYEEEILTEKQKYNEYVMTSLRTSWGCDLKHIENVFGKKYSDYCLKQAEHFIKNDLLILEKTKLFLTTKGKIIADGITAELFID